MGFSSPSARDITCHVGTCHVGLEKGSRRPLPPPAARTPHAPPEAPLLCSRQRFGEAGAGEWLGPNRGTGLEGRCADAARCPSVSSDPSWACRRHVTPGKTLAGDLISKIKKRSPPKRHSGDREFLTSPGRGPAR